MASINRRPNGLKWIQYMDDEKHKTLRLGKCSLAAANQTRVNVAAGYATPTISKIIVTARQIFKDAIDREMLEQNPFQGIKAGSQVNETRRVYVPREDVQRVIEACADPQWRLVLGLGVGSGH